MNKELKCNGVRAFPPEFSKSSEEVFDMYLPLCRKLLVLNAGETEGDRWGNSKDVWLTLRSSILEEVFNRQPVQAIVAALHDCAERDYWYKYEKKWD